MVNRCDSFAQFRIKKKVCFIMMRRFYFDTSVFGRVFDSEFEKESIILFQKVTIGQIECVYSNLTENELINAPRRVRNFFMALGRRS